MRTHGGKERSGRGAGCSPCSRLLHSHQIEVVHRQIDRLRQALERRSVPASPRNATRQQIEGPLLEVLMKTDEDEQERDYWQARIAEEEAYEASSFLYDPYSHVDQAVWYGHEHEQEAA